MPIRRTPFQVRKAIGVNKEMSLCACLGWPRGACDEWIWGHCSCADLTFLLHPPRLRTPVRSVSASRRDGGHRWPCGRFPGGKRLFPEQSWQVTLMLVTLGGYKRVLTGIDADCGLGFAYWVVDANAQSAAEEPAQKVIVPVRMAGRHSCRPRNTFIAHNAQQWAERSSSEYMQ